MWVCLHFQCVTRNPRFLLPSSKPPNLRLSASNSRLLASLLFAYTSSHFASSSGFTSSHFASSPEFTSPLLWIPLNSHFMFQPVFPSRTFDDCIIHPYPIYRSHFFHFCSSQFHYRLTLRRVHTHYKVRENNSLNSINFRLNKRHLIKPRVSSSSSYLLIQQLSQQRSSHSCRGSKVSWLSTVKADRASFHRGLVSIHSFGCTKQLIPGSWGKQWLRPTVSVNTNPTTTNHFLLYA